MGKQIDRDAIGVEVSWSFGDGDAEAVTLPRSKVRDALVRRGFSGALIEDPTADECLRIAMQTAKGRSKSIVIQELQRPNRDTPRAVGVYQVQAREGERGDRIECGARVRVSGDRLVALPPEGSHEISPCMNIALEIERIANSLIDNVVNRDISNALVAIGWSAYWITRRRNSGGVYFIPTGDAAERFISLLDDLRDMTADRVRAKQFIPQVMEVYPKPLTLQMWSGSARDQYDAQVQELVDQLKKMEQDGTMRESTVQKRADECDRLIEQAETHRLFLKEHVEVLTTELTRIRDKFTQRLSDAGAELKAAFKELDAQDAKAKAKRKRAAAPAPQAEPEANLQFPPPEGRELTPDELFDV